MTLAQAEHVVRGLADGALRRDDAEVMAAVDTLLDEYDRRGTELARRAAIVAAAIEFRRASRFTSRESRTPQAAVIRAVDAYHEAAREGTS